MPKHESELTVVEQEQAKNAAAAAAQEAAGEETTAVPGDDGQQETVSRAEFDQLKGERDQLIDRIARLQAEFENARKRAERERTEYRDFATGSAVEQFLPVLDNFQLALGSAATAEQLRAGIELIIKQMEEVLRTLNVLPVETVGVRFDPRVHEALESVDRTDLPDHQVFEEVRRGYRIRDRLLRPALVRIVNNPQQKEA